MSSESKEEHIAEEFARNMFDDFEYEIIEETHLAFNDHFNQKFRTSYDKFAGLPEDADISMFCKNIIDAGNKVANEIDSRIKESPNIFSAQLGRFLGSFMGMCAGIWGNNNQTIHKTWTDLILDELEEDSAEETTQVFETINKSINKMPSSPEKNHIKNLFSKWFTRLEDLAEEAIKKGSGMGINNSKTINRAKSAVKGLKEILVK